MLDLLRDYPLLAHNTFGFAVHAQCAAWLTDEAALPAMRDDARLAGLPRLLIGGGSNLVLTRDFPGVVLLNGLQGRRRVGEDADAWFVEAAAGENWHEFVAYTLDEDMPGLENLALIPGTVGAAPVQNIGAYGVEVANCLHSVRVFDVLDGSWRTLGRDDCAFGYRDSVFKRGGRDRWIITSVVFRLPKRWQARTGYGDIAARLAALGRAPRARDVFDAVCAIRRAKLPDWRETGNAGSFFKNPLVDAARHAALVASEPGLVAYPQPDGGAKLAAGWLIERCGFKGVTRGHAGVHDAQALVLVNRGGASGSEVVALAREIVEAVMTRFGVTLEIEPLVV
ncbi:UDP-N-acetylmuramate dehydrogenase [Chitinasiproducens palmae]|uniref:UDP-N-acetylenolpyruvoylglucosamine reductase n=1 Tax=Chitinasiproducens palmae TaxID=1770053 RepID=A0A1H2PSA5_9BURK|nr:UDP-N-acetylmuramate dehydrogenase [Chitinasiproducens palmae]SDV49435.1 UDP-N-acetylmuramate dehydrogenase [Chitinasiproducens palmae]